MKRPYIVHFIAIKHEDTVNVRATIGLKDFNYDEFLGYSSFTPRFPVQSFSLMKSCPFSLKLEGIDSSGELLFSKEYETDNLGILEVKIPLKKELVLQFSAIRAYESSWFEGVDVSLGSFLPLEIIIPKRVLISDFDKTLVDTKYSSTKDVYNSLTTPIDEFPTVKKSVELIKKLIKDGMNPFILSASPHFYEDSIRDWLYQNNIYSAGIFLKDYRKVLSLFERELTPKDVKVQGLYKLNQLLDIIFLTGIPDKLILMGDNFESDPLVYNVFGKLLLGITSPRDMWVQLQQTRPFMFNRRQKISVLNKLYQMSSLVKASNVKPMIEVYIRMCSKDDKIAIELDQDSAGIKFIPY